MGRGGYMKDDVFNKSFASLNKSDRIARKNKM